MKVVIITEGYQSTGYGHITRCLSFYQAFKELNITPALMVNGDKDAEHFLADSNYEMFNWLDYPELLSAKIGRPDIIIVDSYKTDEKYYSDLFSITKLLAAIDDNMRLDYKAHVVINGTIGSEDYTYKRNKESRYLLGAEYIPLRKEFRIIEARDIKPEIKNVLITMGGQDIRSLTQPILDYFLEHAPYLNYYIVAKESFSIDFKKYTPVGNVEFIFDADALKMKELMMNCDLAVTAAGQTIYELARTGTPSVAVIVADNQIKNLQGWVKNGFILDEIYWNDENMLGKIGHSVMSLNNKTLREDICKKGRDQVDGQGAKKIVYKLIHYINEREQFYFRDAEWEDAENVFNLSNDPVVRANSINTAEIKWKDHLAWFEKKISDANYVYLLCFTKDSHFIGQVRFSIEVNKAVVSISITEKYRGKGMSSNILKSACQEVLLRHSNIIELNAYIKPGNIASINTFIKAGFLFNSVESISKEFYNLYILKR